MLNIEQSVVDKFPGFAGRSPLVRKSTLSLLRKLTREQEINAFLHEHQGQRGIDFIDRIFEYFNFSYSISQRERNNIPAQGKVVIIANHPIGSLDGLALLRLVSEVRKDVKIVANDMLMAFEPLHDLFLPLDNMTRGAYKQSYKNIVQALADEQAVIVFPAGEVSRASPAGIRDGKWQSGFLHFARKAKAPLLPIFVSAKNSLLFYSASMLFKPLATALLAHEMFNKRSAEIKFRVGEMIPHQALDNNQLVDKALIKRLKKHLYKIGKGKNPIFVTEKTIAHPEDLAALKKELKTAQLIGATRDNHKIFLCDYAQHPSVLREIGRLREQTFRLVGEGTGSRRDLDKYDHYYRHLVLWDDEKLCIAGAYRLGDAERILHKKGIKGLYTADLFDYQPAAQEYLQQGLELGRSFVHPDYWGKASLDYLWQGLGAYLQHHPHIRYVFGPVSMSARYPETLRDMLVFYYERYYRQDDPLADGKHPHLMDENRQIELQQQFAHLNREQGFELLQQRFQEQDCKVPVLFKQYAALYEEGGYQLLAFSVDSEFGNCVDGLFMADLTLMKANKRARYLGESSN
ncbi:GNAT family N-acyltransferase [Cellvibrio japonicus]|uniref:L-ornithine N(alpha)-acyltransferase n=1 Tax=Cellvibrio japonicus (strain Ueda107) TaxID=498211 RepID=B3PCQ2_CELJU|nr:lysophospholipid acyltransferase family protein [Cellvibrio japonicus]ACE84560.1 acyltransferase family protein [Cellvibrio japonicus Ueda107]QEI13273.1 lysophospholipid acyltransferase family protein [Cellvibrio japonicus]QEI16847.1 lysophospholipid acyltransferase family protein [Cellvibrio japonicus]QEI20425.1 lysophospholipid acyltransferase family protein [Cellvibrio japonicus]